MLCEFCWGVSANKREREYAVTGETKEDQFLVFRKREIFLLGIEIRDGGVFVSIFMLDTILGTLCS